MQTESQRLRRQLRAIARAVPPMRRPIEALLARDRGLVRIPVALVLILGGVFSFLPVLGLWMLPLGILLLAVDVPPLRRPTSAAVIRSRRRMALWRRARRGERIHPNGPPPDGAPPDCAPPDGGGSDR